MATKVAILFVIGTVVVAWYFVVSRLRGSNVRKRKYGEGESNCDLGDPGER